MDCRAAVCTAEWPSQAAFFAGAGAAAGDADAASDVGDAAAGVAADVRDEAACEAVEAALPAGEETCFDIGVVVWRTPTVGLEHTLRSNPG